jgi:hypothetical protein
MKKICELSLERNLNPVCRVREKLHCKIVLRKEKKKTKNALKSVFKESEKKKKKCYL